MESRLAAGLDNGTFTDLNRLNQFKVGGDSQSNIKKVAQEFESVFVNEMMKAMRKASDVFGDDNFLNSNESKTYRDMYDQQLSVTLSKSGNGIGLANVLERQLSKMKGGSHRPSPFPNVSSVEGDGETKRSGAFKAVDPQRDDSKLLAQRRLSLPSRASSALQAGLAASGGAEGQALAGADWANSITRQTSKVAPLVSLGNEAAATRRAVEASSPTGKSVFASAADFIETMLPMAEEAARKIGVDARYLVAQAALETGWGKSIIRQADGSSSHNLFGIKAHRGWDGDSAKVMTTEFQGGKAVKEAASFRTYDSFAQSFNDYVSFLQGNGRYEEALASTDNPEQFVRELQEAGYATDPQYARKISQIARKMQTYQTIASADTGITRS